MFRDKAPDGLTTRLHGAGLPTRVGTTTSWYFADHTDVDASFLDGYPPRVGDLLVSKNGFSLGELYSVTKVYDNGNVDTFWTGIVLQYHSDTGWFNVGDPGAAPFDNGWQAYGGGYLGPRYRRENGIVRVEGLAKLGVMNTSIFTLPVNFRPGGDLVMGVVMGIFNTGAATTGTAHTHPMNQYGGRVNVQANGQIVQQGAATNNFISLTGINFAVSVQ